MLNGRDYEIPYRSECTPSVGLKSLCDAATFKGQQKSNGKSYEVQVDFLSVDHMNSQVTGHLTIHKLVASHPKITTYFDGEIIGDRYSFLTRKWQASEKIDREHWTRFDSFRPFESTFNCDNFQYDKNINPSSTFMRWKEQFILPCENPEEVVGASYEGFYYIHLDESSGIIQGYYHPKNADSGEHIPYQSLHLTHCVDYDSKCYQIR